MAICLSLVMVLGLVFPGEVFAREEGAEESAQEVSVESAAPVEVEEEVPAEPEEEVSVEPEAEVSAEPEENESLELSEEADEPQAVGEDEETPWSKLKRRIEEADGQKIEINEDITADPVKDVEKTISILENRHIVLTGKGKITGLGLSSIKVAEKGSLTIDGPSLTKAQIEVEGKLELKEGKISDTKLEGATVLVNGGEFSMSGGEFTDNEALEGKDSSNYSPITVKNGKFQLDGGKISGNKSFLKGGAIGGWGSDPSKTSIVINGGEISGNQAIHPKKNAWGGGIYLENGTFEMTGGSVSGNTAELGGGMNLVNSSAKISGGSISENTNGDYKGIGGGISTTDGDLTISGGEFSKNEANGSGGALFTNSTKLTINGGKFTENTALRSGGALSIGGTSRAEINAGIFEGNSSHGFWGGGAIYNDTHSTLVIRRALIKDNTIKENYFIGAGNRPASRQGGGIWNCPTGSTVIYITNGLALYENSAPDLPNQPAHIGAGDDFANITKHEFGNPVGSSSVVLASRMLGGGFRLWYQDGSFYSIHTNWGEEADRMPRYNPENHGDPLPYNKVIVEKKGAQLVYKSVPAEDSKSLAEQIATTIFTNNTAQGTGISGGAIANNGKLIFGDDEPYKLVINKAWSGDKEETRPKEIVLKMYVGDHYIQDVKLTAEGNWEATIEDFPDPETLRDNKTGKLLPINFKEEKTGNYVFSILERSRDEKESTYTIQLENKIPTPTPKEEFTSVKVNKNWVDENNQLGDRPDHVVVALLANGQDTGKRLTLSERAGWEGIFDSLPVYVAAHNRIEYSVVEVSHSKDYTASVSGNQADGFTITNTRIPTEKTKVKVTKVWDDGNNADGKRPDAITVHLYKNGQVIRTVTLNQANGWTWTFEDLEKFEDGKEITYTISEDPVEGYTTNLTGSAAEGFTLTNSKKPETPPETHEPPKTPHGHNPNTGDAGHIVLYAGLVLLSAACLGKLYFRTKREEEA